MAVPEMPKPSEDYNPYAPPSAGAMDGVELVSAEKGVPVTSVSYRLTPEDLQEAMRGLQKKNSKSSMVFLVMLVAVSLGLTVIQTLSNKKPQPNTHLIEKPSGESLSGWGFALLLTPTVLVVALMTYVFWANRRAMNTPPSGEITSAIDAEGLKSRTDFNESKTSWAGYAEIRETPNLILFLLGVPGKVPDKPVTSVNAAVPKRAFGTPEAATSFLAAARRWHAEATGTKPT